MNQSYSFTYNNSEKYPCVPERGTMEEAEVDRMYLHLL